MKRLPFWRMGRRVGDESDEPVREVSMVEFVCLRGIRIKMQYGCSRKTTGVGMNNINSRVKDSPRTGQPEGPCERMTCYYHPFFNLHPTLCACLLFLRGHSISPAPVSSRSDSHHTTSLTTRFDSCIVFLG